MIMSPNIDGYMDIYRERWFAFWFIFLPIPSEYANIWLLVFDNGSCPLKHIFYNCDALHLPGPFLPTSKWILSPQPHFFTKHWTPLLLAAPILRTSVDHTHLSVLYFCPSALSRLLLAFFILHAMLGGSTLFWLGGEDSYRDFLSVLSLFPSCLLWVNEGDTDSPPPTGWSRASRIFVVPHIHWLSPEVELSC